jgi:putative endonuclease
VAYVYLLRCADGSLYCGWTIDVGKRLATHQAGKASRYTASRRPVELAVAWELPDRTGARRLEARVKALTRREKLRLLHGDPPEGAVRFSLPGA